MERNSTITKTEQQSTLLKAFNSPGPTDSIGPPDTTVDLFIYPVTDWSKKHQLQQRQRSQPGTPAPEPLGYEIQVLLPLSLSEPSRLSGKKKKIKK